MPKHDSWPEFCTVIGCTDPSLRPHHHHHDRKPGEGVGKPISVFHCTCGNVDLPGTKPKEPKVVKK